MKEKVEFAYDYYGVCPECGKNDGCLNVGRAHWYVCHEHKTKWFVGSNLFASWRHESEEQWKLNDLLLSNYREVEPLMNPKYKTYYKKLLKGRKRNARLQ